MLFLAGHNLWKFVSCDVNIRDAITGWTPLMVAVDVGYEQFFKQLISRKSDAFPTSERGESALRLAILYGNFDFVRILIDYGGTDLLPRSNIRNREGQTPLMFAIQKHNESRIH